jgi:hypothetical protein
MVLNARILGSRIVRRRNETVQLVGITAYDNRFSLESEGYEAGGSGAEKGNTKDLLTGSEYPYRRKTHIAVPFSLPPTRSHFFNVKPQAVIA